jgi:hypothetical protein
MAHQKNTLFMQMALAFVQKTIEPEVKNLPAEYAGTCRSLIDQDIKIFEAENAVIPAGFDGRNVFDDAPALYGRYFPHNACAS